MQKSQRGRTGTQLPRSYQRAAYHKGVVLLLQAHDTLGGVKTVNWTQARLLNDVFAMLEEAAESLVDVDPNALSRGVRQIVAAWTKRIPGKIAHAAD